MTTTKTHSEKGLQHIQIPGPTDMSDGVMTPEKDSVKLVWSCSAGKEDLNSLLKDSDRSFKKGGLNRLVLFQIVFEFTLDL